MTSPTSQATVSKPPRPINLVIPPALALAILIQPVAAIAQPAAGPLRTGSTIYPRSSIEAENLLRSADSHVRDGQWNEAVSIYLRILNQFPGDILSKIPRDNPLGDPTGETTLYMDLRSYCRQRLAAMPPEGRAVYRALADAQAEGLYREAVRDRDIAKLRRVAEEFFATSWGDDALDALADLAFQDGDFSGAVQLYSHLVHDGPDEAPPGFLHPDPSLDLARVAAKKLLARAALGLPVGEPELRAHADRFPNAAGKLAGREGPYVETVARAIAEDGWLRAASDDTAWPTFAGAMNRSRLAPEHIDLGLGSLQWRLKRPTVLANSPAPYTRFNRYSSTPPRPILAYHPIILGEQILISDDSSVEAYPLNAAANADPRDPSEPAVVKPVWRNGVNQPHSAPVARGLPMTAPRFTLTAHNGRVFARLGPASGGMNTSQPAPSSLLALDQRAEGKILWRVDASEIVLPNRPAGRPNLMLGFEGSPVADDNGVYIALTEGGEASMARSFLACLQPETGKIRWIVFLFESTAGAQDVNAPRMMWSNPVGGQPEHRLLSLEGSTIYYQTNMGAVVAVDTNAGRVRWMSAYPRLPGGTESSTRDLNPAIVHDGKVFVAPRDAPHLMALDAATGRLLWKAGDAPQIKDMDHLLGVADGKLVVTGNHVYLFDVRNGAMVSQWPDNSVGFTGHGRGALAGGKILWPTKSEIHVLDQKTGLRDRPPINLSELFQTTGGNLVVGDGFLAVAGEDSLTVYCQNRVLIQRFRDLVARRPDDPAARFRLAQAYEREGMDEEALLAYAEAHDLAAPADALDGRPVRIESRERRQRLLERLASEALAQNRLPDADALYLRARELAVDDRARLAVSLALADVRERAGNLPAAVDILQQLLKDDASRRLAVPEGDNFTVRADLVVARRLEALLDRHGRELYAGQESEARALFDRARAARDPELLEAIERHYPLAEIVPDALLLLGDLLEKDARPGAAAAVYRRLLARAAAEPLKAGALWRLARVYETQRMFGPARDALDRILRDFPDVRVADPDPALADRDIREAVRDRLDDPAYRDPAALRAGARLNLPLRRDAELAWNREARPLMVAGAADSPALPRLYLQSGRVLRPVRESAANPGSGPGSDPAARPRLDDWSVELAGEPAWLALVQDRLVLADRDGLAAVDPVEGALLWRWRAESGEAPPNPFQRDNRPARDEPANVNGNANANANSPVDPSAPPFLWIEAAAGRVHALRSNRELIALDAETGALEWAYAPTRGKLAPLVALGSDRLVARADSPNRLLVIDRDTGRSLAEIPLPDDEAPWLAPPLVLSDRLAVVVADRVTVKAFDLVNHAPAWTARATATQPNLGPPRLLADDDRLYAVVDGRRLDRLDPGSGKALWSVPLGEENLADRPESVAARGDRVFHASGGVLRALDAGDGRTLWTRRVRGAGAGWNVRALGDTVVVHPDPALVAFNKFIAEEPNAPLPVVFHRAEDGRVVQRFVANDPEAPDSPSNPRFLVRFDGSETLVATDRRAWRLAPLQNQPQAPNNPEPEPEPEGR